MAKYTGTSDVVPRCSYRNWMGAPCFMDPKTHTHVEGREEGFSKVVVKRVPTHEDVLASLQIMQAAERLGEASWLRASEMHSKITKAWMRALDLGDDEA